jgi:hypothetical protein
MVANLLANLRNTRYMNESAVALSDECVVDALQRVHACCKNYFVEPAALLERFVYLVQLLC